MSQILMLKNKIYKYFTVEILKSFFLILFSLTIIAWTVRAVSFLDLIVENGHSITTYFYFTALNITNIITKFIPLSFLIALVLSIIKFDRQNELIIIWTIGIDKMKIVNFFFKLSIFILLIQLLLSVFITPNTLNKSRQLIRLSDFDSISSIIKVNRFSDSFTNLTFFVDKKNSDDRYTKIFIKDNSNSLKGLISSDGKSVNTTITAKEGYFVKKKLILLNGNIQNQDNKGNIKNIQFEKTELNLQNITPRVIKQPKLQETQTNLILRCILYNEDIDGSNFSYACPVKNKIEMIQTVTRRIGMPIYIPLIALISSFLLISRKESKINYMNKYIYFMFGFIFLVAAEIFLRFTGYNFLYTAIYFAAPFFLMLITYVILLKKINFEKK